MTSPSEPKDDASELAHTPPPASDLDRLRLQLQQSQSDLSAFERIAQNELGYTQALTNIEKLTRPSISEELRKLVSASSASSFERLERLFPPSVPDELLKQLTIRTDLASAAQSIADLVQPSIAFDQIIGKHQPYLEAMFSTVQAVDKHQTELRDLAKLWEASSIRVDTRAIVDAVRIRKGLSFEHLFRPLQVADLAGLEFRGTQGSLADTIWGGDSASRFRTISESLSTLQAKLVDVDNVDRSIRALVELQGVGKALETFDAFGSQITRGLRIDLGDWRQLPKFDPSTIIEPAVRAQLYVEQGLDESLTDFPEDGFSAGLAHAGLADDYSLITVLGAFIPEDANDDERFATRRNLFGYEAIHKFERRFRDFIDRSMSAKYGPDWPKRRLPGDTYQAWKKLAKDAEDAGRPMPRLIDCADFTDYVRIVVRNDNFAEVFGPVFLSKERVQESFNRLFPLRLATMHARALTKEDLLYLVTETHRLLQAIGKSGH